jgi:signal peptidase I
MNTAAYDHAAPAIGDIVIFNPPAGAEQDNMCGSGQPPKGQMCARPTRGRTKVLFVKRIVAGPGDRVAMTQAA